MELADAQAWSGIVALVISFASLYFARRSWAQSYRPVVTAFIAENGEGRTPVFDLRVSNTGNRPALEVKLHARTTELEKLLEPLASEEHRKCVAECFSKESSIPVLRDGETLMSALGWFNDDEPWLNYGANAEVTIAYRGIRGDKYKSKMPLKVFTRDGFGGSSWQRST